MTGFEPDSDRDDASTENAGEGVGWPVDLRGVTESVVTTLGPNDRWNRAALGLLVDGGDGGGSEDENGDDIAGDEDGIDGGNGNGAATGTDRTAVMARTWGRTRTWRNFRERGEGYVQFVSDPVVFTEAALSIREGEQPVVDAATAWVRIEVEAIDTGSSGDTEWTEWALFPRERRVLERTVPTINRGHGAVIEATVAASRLDVAAYDTDDLLDRLSYLEGVVERCGGSREREAFSRLVELVDRRW